MMGEAAPLHQTGPAPARPRQRASGAGAALFFFVVAAALYRGWLLRGQHYLTAESGLGYALGIAGGVMMLVLLLYPLRKRWRVMHRWGAVKHWFRAHMMLGVLGPSCILFHADFKLGALNSNVALFCMAVVASSGLMGRYFYAKIHHGLYGSQANLHDLQRDSALSKDQLAASFSSLPQLREQLHAWEVAALRPAPGLLAGAGRVFMLTVSTPLIYNRLWRQCRQAIAAETVDGAARRRLRKQARRYLQDYLAAVRKVAEFGFYVRLFSLWHILHMPLFIMMLITGVVHVVAVHMY